MTKETCVFWDRLHYEFHGKWLKYSASKVHCPYYLLKFSQWERTFYLHPNKEYSIVKRDCDCCMRTNILPIPLSELYDE